MKMYERPIVYQVPGMSDAAVQRDIVYKRVEETELKLDVYAPPDAPQGAQLPGVLFIHGGPVRQDMQPLPKDWGAFVSYGQLMAASGLVGVTFNHRFHSATHLEQANDDVRAALDFCREHATELGLDPDRLCLWVFSGGGPFISFVLREQPEFVRCIVIYYALLRPGKGAAKALRERFTPTAGLDARPTFETPILIARAGLDRRNINESIDAFIQAALAANVPLDVVNHVQGRHAFDILDDNARSRQIIAHTVAFIKAHVCESPGGPALESSVEPAGLGQVGGGEL
jgi:dienelactone hydrolase